MNKTFLSLLFVGGAVAAFGQQDPISRQRARSLKTDGIAPGDCRPLTAPAPVAFGEERAIFWSENFSGGFPAGWTTVDIGTAVGEVPVNFVWTNDPNAVSASSNNNQFNGIDFRLFQSTTASNGYLWADSDRGLPSPGPSQEHVTQLTTTAINCSGQSSVLLAFQSTIGVFDDDASTNALLQVSTNGVDWTDFFPHACLVADSPNPPCARWSYNPSFVELDITSVAANQPTVYLRWQWTGLWEYYWAIDDVELRNVPDYEREMLETVVSHRPLTEGYEYGRILKSQLGGTIYTQASVRNRGLQAQTNMVISGATTGGSPTAFNVSQTFATVNYSDTATMVQSASLSNPGAGDYTLNFGVTSNQDAQEANTADDSKVRQFRVDDQLYSLDGEGVYTNAALTSLGSNSFTNNNAGLTMLTYYPFRSNTTILGVEVLLTSTTTAGSTIRVALRDTAGIVPTGTGAMPTLPAAGLLVESQPVDITAADIAAGKIFVAFDSPYTLTVPANGRPVYASAKLTGTATNIIRIVDDNTVPQPAWASCIHLAVAPSATAVARVYSNGNAFAIRLKVQGQVGVSEMALEGVTLFPNPTDGTLFFRADRTGNYTIEVFDLLGNRVNSTRTNGSTAVDLSGMAKGMYMVRVNDGNAFSTQRITVK